MKSTDSERRRQIEQLCFEIQQLEPGRIESFLQRMCAGDEILRKEIEALLADREQLDRLLEVPALGVAARAMQPDRDVDPMPDLTGRALSHFRIVGKIGAGGMGTVYRARDEHLRRDVAFKVLKAGKLGEESARKRFRKEALSLARLNHPNIAAVYDFDAQDGIDFLVMELVPGITLASKLNEVQLREKEVVSLAMQIADGLAAAQAQNIVHRDLKPGNLIITPEGRLKILDFGLATLIRPTGPEDSTISSDDLHKGCGTLHYMSPEQLTGETVDHRSDIYAVGTILYQVLTGRLPFRASSAAAFMNLVINKPPDPPRELRPDLSPRLEDVVLKCLEKDPEDRYQSAKELLIDLRRLNVAWIPSSRPAPWLVKSWRSLRYVIHKSRWIQAVSVLILLGILAAPPAWLYRDNLRSLLGLPLPLPDQKVLVILPFRVISGDAQSPAFADGLNETLTARLTQLLVSNDSQVLPSSEVRRSKVTSAVDARRELGANLVLDGSLQFFGKEVRAALSLLDARSNRLLRSDVITGESIDSFLLQDKVVDCVLRLLEVQLESSQMKRLAIPGSINPEAYLFYTQGMGYLYGFHPKSIENAIPLFQRAIDWDSKFADAHAGLGLAYWNKSGNGRDSTWADRAEKECGNALNLEKKSVPALICLGTLHSGTGEYGEAVIFFEDALEIDPSSEAAYRGLAQAYESQGKINDAEATYLKAVEVRGDWTSYQWLGRFYNYQARYEEAAAQYRRAAELTPDNHRPLIGLGGAYYFLGHYDEAIRTFKTANGICPTGAGYQNLGNAYLGKRQFREAVSSLEEALRLNSDNYVIAGNLAKAYYWSPGNREKGINAFREAIKLGMQELKINSRNADAHVLLARYFAMVEQRAEALEHLERALKLRPDDPEYALIAAVVHNRVGDREAAFHWLKKAVRGNYSIAEIRDDLDLSDLRSDPRFLRLIQ